MKEKTIISNLSYCAAAILGSLFFALAMVEIFIPGFATNWLNPVWLLIASTISLLIYFLNK